MQRIFELRFSATLGQEPERALRDVVAMVLSFLGRENASP
jgi:hypothetical protein